MDLSSETVHALLPVFLVSSLGASLVAVGWIEGLAEATASIVKVFSGVLSDRLARRKPLVALGYGLAALTKPVFPLAPSLAWVTAARCIDRVGKGIRGAPRDALLAELTPRELRGASYGLRQALDTAGAFAGPLLAVALMAATAGDLRRVFWFAVAPAAVAFALVLLGVDEPDPPAGAVARAPLRRAALRGLGAPYAIVLGVGSVLALARFSEAFLVLRAADAGLPATLVPLVLVAMNATYTLSAYPSGALSDRIGRRGLLAAGLGVLVASDLVLAGSRGVAGVLAGVALWGLHLGVTQGLLAALVADAAPAALRGTAFGLFHLASGLALLAGSPAAGWLWQRFGPPATFLAGAAVVGVALLLIPALPATPPGAAPRADAAAAG
jgi:MFS family permease